MNWLGDIHGWVSIDTKTIKTVDHVRAFLIGMLAGCEAHSRWADENNKIHWEGGCQYDYSQVAWVLKNDPLAKGMTVRNLKPQARRVIRDNWTTITKHAEELARRGTHSI